MEFKEYISNSPEETMRLGKELSAHLKPGAIICLDGELGSGKTTFIKGMAQGLAIDPNSIHSPTFTLLNIYDKGKIPLYHFDLYRLDTIRAIEEIGYEEFFYGTGICVVEWASKLNNLFPKECVTVKLEHQTPQTRKINIAKK